MSDVGPVITIDILREFAQKIYDAPYVYPTYVLPKRVFDQGVAEGRDMTGFVSAE